MRALIAAATAVLLASTSLALACGVERWPVKTATDRDAGRVVLAPNASTIPSLRATPAPPNPDARRDTRFAPVETSIVVLSGILVVIKREQDEDYHLVIADPSDPQATMIIESPNPRCALGSRFFQNIVTVRRTIDSHFGGPIGGRHQVRIPVRVAGIAFFDRIHGQEGVAPNGIELHPIIGIRFD
jgi:hypothetical protein